jgi:mRNA interferase RelE/StbE
MFKVILHKKALKEIDSFPGKDRKRILASLHEMELDPFNGNIKPLKPLRALFRKRIGDYRVIFIANFERSEVIILKIDKRENIYEKL